MRTAMTAHVALTRRRTGNARNRANEQCAQSVADNRSRRWAALFAARRIEVALKGTARHDVSDPAATSRGWPQRRNDGVVHIMARCVTGTREMNVVGGLSAPCVVNRNVSEI